MLRLSRSESRFERLGSKSSEFFNDIRQQRTLRLLQNSLFCDVTR